MAAFQTLPLVKLLALISSASSAVPFLAGLYVYRSLTTPMRILLILILFAVLTEIAGVYFGLAGIQNIWFLIGYIIVETGFVLWIISYWHKSTLVMWFSLFGITVYSLFVIISQIIWGPGAMYLEVNATRSILLSIAIIYTMFRLVDMNISYIRDHRFWVLTSYIIYFTGTSVMYTAGLFTTSEVYMRMYAIAHSGLNIPSNIIIAGAFLLCRRR